MRLIDADALIERAYIMQEPNGFIHSVVTERQINATQTIDAVPVVRCKDCRRMNEDKFCVAWEGFVREDDFCSYGERKEGADGRNAEIL